jgi:ferredoxin/flavodoxin
VYFSAAGGTKYICDIVKKGLKQQGHTIDLIPIKNIHEPLLNFDEIPILGIASPVYDFNFSRIVRFWMRNIPYSTEPKKVFLIETCAGIPCASIDVVQKTLLDKNYSLVGALEVTTPTAEPWFDQKWNPWGWRKANIHRAFFYGMKLGKDLRKKKATYLDFKMHLPGLNFLSYSMLKIDNQYNYGYIKLRKSLCNECHACESVCSVNAIKINRKKVIGGYSCMFCIACVRICPTHALYISYRPKATPPTKSESPKLIKGYIDPTSYKSPKHFKFTRNYFSYL